MTVKAELVKLRPADTAWMDDPRILRAVRDLCPKAPGCTSVFEILGKRVELTSETRAAVEERLKGVQVKTVKLKGGL